MGTKPTAQDHPLSTTALVSPQVVQETSVDRSLLSLVERLESRIQALEARPVPSVEELTSRLKLAVQEQLSSLIPRMISIMVREHLDAQ